MPVITLKVRTLIIDEEYMESIGKYSLDSMPASSSKWGWRRLSIGDEQIYSISEHSRNSTIVRLMDDELLLVDENFDSVREKWNKAREEEPENKEEEEE